MTEAAAPFYVASDLNEAQAPRLRADLEARLDHSLIVGVTWTQHHSVLAKGDRLPVAIGRNVPDGKWRHNKIKA
jgi:hypothetical protein